MTEGVDVGVAAREIIEGTRRVEEMRKRARWASPGWAAAAGALQGIGSGVVTMVQGLGKAVLGLATAPVVIPYVLGREAYRVAAGKQSLGQALAPLVPDAENPGILGLVPLVSSGYGFKEWLKTGDPRRWQEAALVDLAILGAAAKLAKAKAAPEAQAAGKLTDNLANRNWPAASIEKAISRHAGENYTTWVTNTGKRIYENPATGRQVVHDLEGGYFRIFQPNAIGSQKGTYLNMLGNELRPARFGAGGVHNPLLRDVDKRLWQQETHFFIEELLGN